MTMEVANFVQRAERIAQSRLEDKGEPMKRLFVDMDGTLAEFRQVDTLEQLYEKGYFENLRPQTAVIEAVKIIVREHPEVEVHILSAVLSDSAYALEEKNAWIDRYLPEIDASHRLFPPCGSDKKEIISGGVTAEDFLLDDYTLNLNAWEPPARGIKLLNGINHTKGTWQKARVSWNCMPETLAAEITGIINGQELYRGMEQRNRNAADPGAVVWHYVTVEKTCSLENGRTLEQGTEFVVIDYQSAAEGNIYRGDTVCMENFYQIAFPWVLDETEAEHGDILDQGFFIEEVKFQNHFKIRQDIYERSQENEAVEQEPRHRTGKSR